MTVCVYVCMHTSILTHISQEQLAGLNKFEIIFSHQDPVFWLSLFLVIIVWHIWSHIYFKVKVRFAELRENLTLESTL